MMVKEAGGGADTRIGATDLDETILAQARASSYAEHQMVGVSDARRARFFDQQGAYWVVKPALRSMVTWRRHDLLRDPFPADQDLIACRNVVIYFNDDAKEGIYARFFDVLRPGGILFVGSTERVSDTAGLGWQRLANFFYVRP